MIKLELFLAAADDPARLPQSLVHAVDGAALARVTVHDPTILAGLAHANATDAGSDAAPTYSCFVDVACESATAAGGQIRLLAQILDGIDGIDRPASTVVAGPEYVVVPGDEQIMLAMALTRRPDLSFDAFSEYWRTVHAELGRSVPGSEGYRQVHRDETLTAAARQALGFAGTQFDGVALAYYSTKGALEAILADEQLASTLLADERRFIDHSRAAMIVGTRPA